MRSRNFSQWSVLVNWAAAICLITAVVYAKPSLAAPASQANPGNGVALDPTLESFIQSKLADNAHVKLDLYVMGHCPYGMLAEQALIPKVVKWGKSVAFNLYFIADEDGNGGFTSLHGQDEVDEDIRQLVIAKYYPDQLLDYVLARSADSGADWQQQAAGLGIDAAKVQQIAASAEGKDLLRTNIQVGNKLGVSGSPTLFVDDDEYAGAISRGNGSLNNGAITGRVSNRVQNTHLPNIGAITGRVTEQIGGEPVADADVLVTPCGEAQSHIGHTKTDLDGVYLVANLPAGCYRVTVFAAGFASRSQAKITVAANQMVSGIDFILSKASTISGRVTSADSGAPVAGADVFIENSLEVSKWVETTSDGSYAFEDLPAAVYTVTVQADGYVTIVRLVNTVEKQNITDNDFSLSSAGAISGQVTEMDGTTPISGCLVLAISEEGEAGFAKTDVDGSYIIENLPPSSNYAVIFQKDGYAQASWNGLVEVEPGKTNTEINLALALGATISGQVFGSDGISPVSGAMVTAVVPGTGILTTTTSTDGSYSFDSLPPASNYTLWVDAVGLAAYYKDGISLSAGQHLANMNFQLVDLGVTGSISGRVVNEQNEPLANVTVYAFEDTSEQEGGFATGITDAQGNYTLTGLIPSKNYVLIGSSLTAKTGVSVDSGQVTGDTNLTGSPKAYDEITYDFIERHETITEEVVGCGTIRKITHIWGKARRVYWRVYPGGRRVSLKVEIIPFDETRDVVRSGVYVDELNCDTANYSITIFEPELLLTITDEKECTITNYWQIKITTKYDHCDGVKWSPKSKTETKDYTTVEKVPNCPSTPPPPSTNGAGFIFGPSAPIDTLIVSIPPEGGSLQSLDGRVTISFPPGSVSTPVKIAYAPQPNVQVSSHFSVLKAFTVGAYEGGSWQKTADFDQPVEVQVTYTEADARFANEKELSLYYFNTGLNEWVPIQSEVNTAQHTLVAKVKNFGLIASLYAVMVPITPTISASSTLGRLVIVATAVLALLVVLGGWLVFRRGRQRKTTSNA